MKKQLLILSAIVFVCTISIFMINMSVYADSLDNIRVLKISPQDGRAVVKTGARKLIIIKEGDLLPVTGNGKGKEAASSRLLVKEIAGERVVFEEHTEQGKETVIVRLENGKQRIERLRRVPEKMPLLYKPEAIEVKETGGHSVSGHGSRKE